MDDGTLFSIALEATALLALWLALGVWQHDREASGRLPFLGLAAAVFVWCLGALLAERGAVGTATGLRIVFLGVVAVPPLWVGVAAHAARLGLARRIPWFPLALLVPSAAFYALLYAGPWSELFLGRGEWPESQGPIFRVWIVYAYALILIATAILLDSAWRAPPGRVRHRRAATALSAVLPLAGNAVFLFLVEDARDLTPVLLAITLIALRSGIFHGGLLDALPIHHRDVYRQLPIGIVLADAHEGVIDLNAAASERLGVPREEVLGRALDAVLAAAPPGLSVEVTPVRAEGREKARCAILREREAGTRDAA